MRIAPLVVLVLLGLSTNIAQAQNSPEKMVGIQPGNKYEVITEWHNEWGNQTFFEIDRDDDGWTLRVAEIRVEENHLEFYRNTVNHQERDMGYFDSWGGFFLYMDWDYWERQLRLWHNNNDDESFVIWNSDCQFIFQANFQNQWTDLNVTHTDTFEEVIAYNKVDGALMHREWNYFSTDGINYFQDPYSTNLEGTKDCKESPVIFDPEVDLGPQLEPQLGGINSGFIILPLFGSSIIGATLFRRRINL